MEVNQFGLSKRPGVRALLQEIGERVGGQAEAFAG